jgi:hypothetical protein
LAITHLTPQLIGRSNGRSAVLSAAYRHCAKMTYEIEARTVDYSNKKGLVREELAPPAAIALFDAGASSRGELRVFRDDAARNFGPSL